MKYLKFVFDSYLDAGEKDNENQFDNTSHSKIEVALDNTKKEILADRTSKKSSTNEVLSNQNKSGIAAVSKTRNKSMGKQRIVPSNNTKKIFSEQRKATSPKRHKTDKMSASQDNHSSKKPTLKPKDISSNEFEPKVMNKKEVTINEPVKHVKSTGSSRSAEELISAYADGDYVPVKVHPVEFSEITLKAILSPQQRAEIILWLENRGVYSASASYRRTHRTPQDKDEYGTLVKKELSPLDDPWCNGVLLCELAAVLCKTGDRSLIKEVLQYI